MRTLSLLALTAVSLLAQGDNWMLLRGIYPGQDTHVHTLDGRLQKGGFISTTDDTIVIRRQTGDETFSKSQIQKVSVRKLSKRARNSLVGAGIGALAMGGLAAAVTRGDGSVTAAAALGYGIIGAEIGALFPGYDTLYRTSRR